MTFVKWWTIMYTVARKPAWRSKLQQSGFTGNTESLETKEEIWEALSSLLTPTWELDVSKIA
eukprot:7069002-Karenia_brevis.AAC.1